MKNIIKLEEFGIFILSILLFAESGFAWWVFPAVLLLPDISMIGYLINNSTGAVIYNIFHHKGMAVIVLGLGLMQDEPYLIAAGSILLGHSAMDRIFGYGLKYFDSFTHTHLGRIGNKD